MKSLALTWASLMASGLLALGDAHAHPNQITDWKNQLLENADNAFAGGERAEPAVDVKALHAKIGQLTL